MSLDIFCKDFDDGDALPSKYTQLGDNVNPAFTIEGIPDDAESLVLIFDDIDSNPKPFVHWMMWNIPPDVRKIFEDEVPEDAVEGYNDFGSIGYAGPKSDAANHKFQFHLYALDIDLELDEDVTREKLEKEIAGHILDEAILTVSEID